jgi:hypothetical protein
MPLLKIDIPIAVEAGSHVYRVNLNKGVRTHRMRIANYQFTHSNLLTYEQAIQFSAIFVDIEGLSVTSHNLTNSRDLALPLTPQFAGRTGENSDFFVSGSYTPNFSAVMSVPEVVTNFDITVHTRKADGTDTEPLDTAILGACRVLLIMEYEEDAIGLRWIA